MQSVKLPYLATRVCTEMLGFTKRETIIFLENIGNIDAPVADKGTCSGDSDGPIHYRGQLIGIVSFGYQRDGQCLRGIVGGYTRVSSYLGWIEHHIARSEGRDPGPVIKRFVTGSRISLKTSKGQYVVAINGGGGDVTARRDQRGAWETFEVIERGQDLVSLRTGDGSFLSADGGGGRGLFANRRLIGAWETFKVIHSAETASRCKALQDIISSQKRAGIRMSTLTVTPLECGKSSTSTLINTCCLLRLYAMCITFPAYSTLHEAALSTSQVSTTSLPDSRVSAARPRRHCLARW